MKYSFTLVFCFVTLLFLAVNLSLVGGQEKELTADQKHELEMFHKMGGVGEPTSFKKRFIKADRPGLPDTWAITFTYEVSDQNLERVANEIAKEFGLNIKRGGLIKGDYARMAIVTGKEDALKQVSEHHLVRRVEQDSQGKGSYGPSHKPETPPPAPQLKPRPKPSTSEEKGDDNIAPPQPLHARFA